MLAIATVGISPAAHANLIANGDFETGTASPWELDGFVHVVGAHSIYGGTDFWFGGGSPAQNGDFAIAFNAGDTQPPNGTVSQSFATVAGLSYRVQYDFGVTDTQIEPVTTHQISASVLGAGDVVLASQTAIDHGPPMPLTTFSFLFTANSNLSTLLFADFAGNPTVSRDGILDNISVTSAIPEPQTYLLVLAGLVLLGFRARRAGWKPARY